MNERIEYSESAHDETIGAIEELFRGSLSKERANEVSAHVLSCDRCERVYQRYADAERALFAETNKNVLTPFAQDRVRARLFGDAPPKKSKVPSFLLSSAVTVALACVLAIFIIPPQPELMSRGTNAETLAPESKLRALVLVPKGEAFEVIDLAAGDRGLQNGDRLKILADSSAQQRFASAIIAGENGRVLAELQPVEIGPNAKDAAVGETITVAGWPPEVKIVLRLGADQKRAGADDAAKDEGSESVRVLKVRVSEVRVKESP